MLFVFKTASRSVTGAICVSILGIDFNREAFFTMIVSQAVLWCVFSAIVNYGSAVPLAQNISELEDAVALMFEEQSLTYPRLDALETSEPGAIEGDILLANATETRKIIADEDDLWPAGANGTVVVPYTFGDRSISRSRVREAIEIWTDNTCIQFEEVSKDFDEYYLIFRSASSCSSHAGRVIKGGQTIRLHPACLQIIYRAVHEIGHALGFMHEQSRFDRDDYVRIIPENIVSGAERNFQRLSTNSKGVLYDYFSVMHYGNRFFTSNDGPTIVSLDPLQMSLMGNRDSFSFRDVKLANIVYKCIDQWQEACGVSADACLNEGYVGKTCQCICPDGTTGDKCENVDMEYSEAIRKKVSPYSEKIDTPGTISTPGYPTPLQTRTLFTKMLVAPANHRVKLVIEDFDLFRRVEDQCGIAFLAIYPSLEMNTQTMACDRELERGTEFLSESDTLLLEYASTDFAGAGFNYTRRGFKASVFHVPIVRDLLVDRQRGRCSMLATNITGRYLFQSPGYPGEYGSFDSCSFELSTVVPSYLRITALEVELGWIDCVQADFELFDYRSYGFKEEGEVQLVPTSHVAMEFWAAPFSSGKFNLQIEVLSSNCHKIIQLEEGDTGVLTLPSTYLPNTICEWWLVAPKNMKIHLRVPEKFYIGANDFIVWCTGDYLVVDKKGDRRYDSYNEKFCGRESDEYIRSRRNKMNILFNGKNGGSNNFVGHYSVESSFWT
ncbi:CUB domain [Trinorchestia longiramus]|nr:CUB domain [Trinorchestia longiramus]